jgi:asparagine N-glycosylation enzyme membrane subunit Stt3
VVGTEMAEWSIVLSFILYALPVYFIPGVLSVFALLRGVKLALFEKILLGAIVGLLLNATLEAIEFILLGLALNSMLAVANALLITAVSVFFLYRQGQLKVPSLSFNSFKESTKKDWVAAILLILLMLFSFYSRIETSHSPTFFEFDPHYYSFVTEMLVKQGTIPVYTDDSYYPQEKFHRLYPIMHYLTGSWYLLHKDFLHQAFDKFTMILVIQLYPPLVALFAVFFLYLLFKEVYGRGPALAAAGFFAFTPQLIQKFAAGVSEQQPFGLFLTIMLFAFYGLAVNRKSYRLALLAGFSSFASILGSAQYVWPFAVLSGYILLQSLVDYFLNELDKKTLYINGVTAAGAVLGNLFLYLYRTGLEISGLVGSATLLLLLAFVFNAILYFALTRPQKIPFVKNFSGWRQKLIVLAALAVIGAIGLFVLPQGQALSDFISGNIALAKPVNPLTMTVAEENPTSEGLLEDSFAFLNPIHLFPVILLFLIILSGLVSFDKLWRSSLFIIALVFLLFVHPLSLGYIFLLLFVVGGISAALWLTSHAFRDRLFSMFLVGLTILVIWFNPDFFVLEVLLAFICVLLILMHSENKNLRLLLLFAIIIFPVAYIGLNKLKFMLHLGIALVFAAGLFLGLLKFINSLLVERLRDKELVNRALILTFLVVFEAFMLLYLVGVVSAIPKELLMLSALVLFGIVLYLLYVFPFDAVVKGMIIFTVCLALLFIVPQFPAATGWPPKVSCDEKFNGMFAFLKLPFVSEKQSPMLSLCYSRLSGDWLQALDWMKKELPENARILSWWDYGHWTVFFGERKTVLDPGNVYANYDIETAHAFVDGTTEDLYKVLDYHHATHVLVDSEIPFSYLGPGMIGQGKWSALVFLSGVCAKKMVPTEICPENPAIDWQTQAGRGTYDIEHYLEFLYPIGQCPANISPVPIPLLQSSFSSSGQPLYYCVGQSDYILAAPGSNWKRAYKLVGRDSISYLDGNTSYIFSLTEKTLLNVNPDLSFAGLKNEVFHSQFMRLYFWEQLPGFELVYKSPGGQVKIFKYVGKTAEQPPAPTPTPTPSPSPSPTPSPEANESNASANETAFPTPTPQLNESANATNFSANSSFQNQSNAS